jgi:two-component system, response regulator PdtaR
MAETPSLGRTIVLVAEDEALLRLFTADYLTDAGFRVIEAPNAAEALRVLETTPAVRVLFTDVEMPGGIDGLELAREVQRRWPGVVIIVTSGHVRPAREELASSAGFFQKPVREEAVVQMIRERVSE